MKFSYTALTKDNKKITGILDAENTEAAQAELHKMGVAIISVKEISEEEYERLKKECEAVKVEKGIQTFNFRAIDPNGKEVEGTIDAMDEFSAYRRLRIEYQFKVHELYRVGATETKKEEAKAMLGSLEEQLAQEKIITKERKEEEFGEETINKEVIAEVDKVIVNTKKAMEKHKELFSSDLLKKIENTLGELERIRTSNNIKHITEVSNNLYSLIGNPDKIEAEKVEDKDYQQLIGEIRDSALVKKEFELYEKAIKFTGFKKLSKNITKRLKELTAQPEEGTGKAPGVISKLKLKIHTFLEKSTKKKPLKPRKKVEKAKVKERAVAEKKAKKKRDFTILFVEIDSFMAWLLCFYIIYFFLISFSLEKNVGLSREFIFKTLKTPLLLNITIFLLLMHFTLRIKNLHFQKNTIATFFLIALSLGIYALLIVNF